MADDLDALFGAFDGDDGDDAADEGKEEIPSEAKSSAKKALRGGDDGEGGDGDDGGEADVGPADEDDSKKKKEKDAQHKSADASSTYASVMTSAKSAPASKPPSFSGGSADKKSDEDAASDGVWIKPKDNQGGQVGDPSDDPYANPALKAEAAAKKTENERKAEAAEVNTGTSHDKSIRSYSAVPDAEEKKAGEEEEEEDADKEKEKEERPPAKVYPFQLDPFQEAAVGYVEKGESVLVAAHTSAGKTAVAEYAIAKSLRDGQRVVYTSPIKALSNQKFRDLSEEFEDVGLMTGDITINPDATCLVMTTEILRSMLYRGSEVMREVAWVIFDEVHYMRDKERGVVWEETIILLPHRVRFVFLSATIPNAKQFVDWIARIHHQPCHVVYTNYRPVPLQHYIYPKGGEGLHLVVDERGKFREGNFQRAMATLQAGGAAGTDRAGAEAMLNSGGGKGGGRGQKRKRQSGVGGKGGGGRGGQNEKSDLHRIVKLVMERNLDPVIVFSFSKKDCERYALDLQREDYTDDVEKDLISQVYKNAIESLSEDDRKLPQVEALLPLLKKGVGIHHGGLLPILKEIVEILFSEGLVKALFATETFSIGINMPAKTVVFTNARKWDGQDFRWVTSGEYIQMSGRAGRRGKDDRGIVIQMLDERMEPSVCKGILYGDPDPLNSSYRISYNMLLNMMRVEDVDPEYLLRASFYQFQQESEAPALEAQADELESEATEITVGENAKDEELAGEYFRMERQLDASRRGMMRIVRKPDNILPFVQKAGRLLDVTIDGENYGWGCLISYRRRAGMDTAGSAGKAAREISEPQHTLEVLLPCVDRHFDERDGKALDDKEREEDASNQGLLWRGTAKHCRPVLPITDDPKLSSMRQFTITFDDVDRISAVRIHVGQQNKSPESRAAVMHSVKEVQKRFPAGVPLLDPVRDLKIQSDDFRKLLERAKALQDRLSTHDLSEVAEDGDDKMDDGDKKGDDEKKETQRTAAERDALIRSYSHKSDLLDRARLLRRDAASRKTVVLRDDLRRMKRVLRHLGHVDALGVIQTKGRAACEVNTANELLVVEMLFSGAFNDLGVEQTTALMSCLTFDEQNKEGADAVKGLKGYLANPLYKSQECARTVARAANACKMEMDEDYFVDCLNPGMMEAVFALC